MLNLYDYTIYIDGACKGNPGLGYISVVMIGNTSWKCIHKELGETTNNIAEYSALLEALSMLEQEDTFIIKSDSELLVKQVNGEYQVKNATLKDLHSRATSLLRSSKGTVVYIPREQNIADTVANIRVDGVERFFEHS